MRVFLAIIVVLIFCDCGFAAKDSSFITIIFNNTVSGHPLELGRENFNPFNEPFTVNRFKYYISNLAFYNTTGTVEKVSNSYYLINEQDSNSKKLTLSIKNGNYNGFTFLLGIDSIKNVSGTQTDALDPMNGMFWTWNSGYINAKLEATSPLSKAPGNLVEYHIGGFRSNQNTIKKIFLPFSLNLAAGNENGKQVIVIEADINKWFSGAYNLKIAEHAACTTPGNLAVKFADNYAAMFKIVSISN